MSSSATQLNAAISNCINLDMIPMIECHDATGNWDLLDEVIEYWTRSDIVNVIRDHEEYLLLNIANECGDYFVSANVFKTGYEAAIMQIRNAGIHVPLVIDGTDWGKNVNILQSQGPYLIEADPDHNLIFSVHMWWPRMYGFSEVDITNEIEQSVNMDLPLIVGEFLQMHGSCDEDEITPQNSIAYLTIIEQCHLNEIGWIAWSWFGNCNPFWDMTTRGTYATLYDWGLEVAVTNQYSIQNISIRPYSIVNGVCNPSTVESRGDVVHPTGFELRQNFPNPFNVATQISYTVLMPANITLEIYNINGRKVRTLIDDWKLTGNHTIKWNGADDSGIVVANGIYVYHITAIRDSDIFRKANRMILLK